MCSFDNRISTIQIHVLLSNKHRPLHPHKKIRGCAAVILMNVQKCLTILRKGSNFDVRTRAAPLLLSEEFSFVLVSSAAVPLSSM